MLRTIAVKVTKESDDRTYSVQIGEILLILLQLTVYHGAVLRLGKQMLTAVGQQINEISHIALLNLLVKLAYYVVCCKAAALRLLLLLLVVVIAHTSPPLLSIRPIQAIPYNIESW